MKDLIESNLLNVISLRRLYRQGNDSNIITIAHDVNNGIVDESVINTSDDLTFIDTKENILEK